MVGAGAPERIYKQMGNYPIDIIGNYGMAQSQFVNGKFTMIKEDVVNTDKDFFIKNTEYLRQKYGYTKYKGDSVEFHATGMVTFALLGTKADVNDKISFDPDRSKRKVLYPRNFGNF